MAENVCVAFAALVTEAGEIATAAFTVTVAVAVAAKLSVTRTVTEPAVAGAVKAPVDALIAPPPLTIEYVNGPLPPTAENVCVLLTAKVTAAGVIPNAFVIVSVEFAVWPKLSVTRITALPAVAGAVKAPVRALMLPPPEKTVNMRGATPPAAENVKLPFTDNVMDAGAIVNAGFTVTVELAVAAKASVTRTVTVPAAAGAVNAPVDELMLPPPLTIE